jgi:hypothetical protein
VVEVEVDLHHNPTGKDLSGLLHRARQARAIARELTRRRAWRPGSNGRPDAGPHAGDIPPAAASPGAHAADTPADAGSPGGEGSPGAREGGGGSPQPPPPPSPPDHPGPTDGRG